MCALVTWGHWLLASDPVANLSYPDSFIAIIYWGIFKVPCVHCCLGFSTIRSVLFGLEQTRPRVHPVQSKVPIFGSTIFLSLSLIHTHTHTGLSTEKRKKGVWEPLVCNQQSALQSCQSWTRAGRSNMATIWLSLSLFWVIYSKKLFFWDVRSSVHTFDRALGAIINRDWQSIIIILDYNFFLFSP